MCDNVARAYLFEANRCRIFIHVLIQEIWQGLCLAIPPGHPKLIHIKLDRVVISVSQPIMTGCEDELFDMELS